MTAKTAHHVLIVFLAALLLAQPELQSPFTRIIFTVIWMAAAFGLMRRLHSTGILSRSPREIFEMEKRPRVGFVEWVAVVGGACVMVAIAA